jgi:hypothetical protein
MTIGRIEFEGGYSVDLEQNINASLGRLIKDNYDKVEILPQGTFDLTPEVSGSNSYRQLLHVFPSGKGIMEFVPLSLDASIPVFSEDGVSVDRGNKIVRIPQDFGSLVVIAESETGEKQIREVVIYTPGPSPKQ